VAVGSVLLGMIAPASAGLPDDESWQTYTTADGLPSDSVRALAVQGGRIWVGTDGGLALFDGAAWTSWTHLDAQNGRDPARPVTWDGPAGSLATGITVDAGGEAGADPIGRVSALALDEVTGDLWVGTWGNGLLRFTAGRFDRFDQINSGLAGNVVFDVAVLNGRVWAATSGGVSRFDPVRGDWGLLMERRADEPEAPVTRLLANPVDGGLYAAVWCEGLRRIDPADDTVHILGNPPGEPEHWLFAAAAVDPRVGRVWWCPGDEVFRFDGPGQWGVLPRPQVWPRVPSANCAAVRENGQIWIGTDAGIRIMADAEGQHWFAYQRDPDGMCRYVRMQHDSRTPEIIEVLGDCLAADRVRAIAFTGADVWVGTAHGLARGRRADLGRPRQGASEIAKRRPSPAPRQDSQKVDAAPQPVDSGPIRIGVWSPVSRTMVLPGQSRPTPSGREQVDVPAVQLAVEQANAQGGFRGRIAFEFVFDEYGYSHYGWGLPEDNLVDMVADPAVLGVVACLEPNSRFATATAWRAELPVISSAGNPPSPDERSNPWLFRPANTLDDGAESLSEIRTQWLVDQVLDVLQRQRPAVVRCAEPAAPEGLDELIAYARRRGCPPVVDLRCARLPNQPEASDPTSVVVSALRAARADAVFVCGSADEAAALLRRLRQEGLELPLVGGRQIVTDRFIRQAGDDPGMVWALWGSAALDGREPGEGFDEAYAKRLKRRPSTQAGRSHEAATCLLRAIELAGPDRQEVAATLRECGEAAGARLDCGRWRFYGPEKVSG